MKMSEEMKPLTKRSLRMSKRIVVASLLLLAVGLGLVFSPWKMAMTSGVALCAVALGIFLSAGLYWGCDNESCS